MAQSTQMILISCLAALAAMSQAATVPPTVSVTSSGLPTTDIASSSDVSTMAANTNDTTTANTVTTTEIPTTGAGIHITLSIRNFGNTTTEVPSTTTTTSTTTSTTTTPTTVKKAPRMCYSCNSGSRLPGMWYNRDCTENGTIGDNHKPMACARGYCFTAVGPFPVGGVFRGCGKDIYVRKTEKVKPGCSMRGNKYVCLCTSDDCNKHDLSEKAEEYLKEHYRAEAERDEAQQKDM